LLNRQGSTSYEYDDDDVLKRKHLNVREDRKVGVFVDGLMHAEVSSLQDANIVMELGMSERTVQVFFFFYLF
jgi:hypothetical protein